MSKAPRWRDDDPDDYAADSAPEPKRPRIDIPRLKRKLASKPPQSRISAKLNIFGRPLDGDPDNMKEYPEEF